MVSNVLDVSVDELVTDLARIRREHAAEPEYQQARAELPPDWPM
jgi:hypothetical protein